MRKPTAILLLCLWSASAASQTWDEHVYLGKQEHASGNLDRAAELLERAANLKGRDNSEWFLYAAILRARLKQADKAFRLIEKAVDAGMFDVARLERNRRLAILRADSRWSALRRSIRAKESAYVQAANLSSPALRTELKRMWKADQDAIGEWELRRAVIERNSKRLSELIEQHGWPTISMVGKDGSWLAWAIVQHSLDLDLQRRCLRLIEAEMARGEAEPTIYAELYDRILKNTGQPQWYGMATMKRGDRTEFWPIAQRDEVDERRKRIGLPPLQVWANVNHIKMPHLDADDR